MSHLTLPCLLSSNQKSRITISKPIQLYRTECSCPTLPQNKETTSLSSFQTTKPWTVFRGSSGRFVHNWGCHLQRKYSFVLLSFADGDRTFDSGRKNNDRVPPLEIASTLWGRNVRKIFTKSGPRCCSLGNNNCYKMTTVKVSINNKRCTCWISL